MRFGLSNSTKPDPVNLKPRARITQINYVDNNRKSYQYFYGFAHHSYRPVAYANNMHNGRVAIMNRVLKATPPPNAGFLINFTRWVKRNFENIFPKMCKTVCPFTMDFETYLRKSNAKPGVKRTLRRVYYEMSERETTPLTFEQCKAWTLRKSFVKVENLTYRSPIDELSKASRLIQGAQPEFICLVGPWIAKLQERIKRDWNKNNFIVFTSSVSNLDAAKKLMEVIGTLLEDDVSAWDASVCDILLRLELWICKRMQAPIAVQQLIEANIPTRGVTEHYFYKCAGMRKSGDPYTSLFNSVLNGLLHLYIYCQHYNLTVSQARLSMRMLVQGDDNVMSFLQKTNLPNFQAAMLLAGFSAQALYRSHTSQCEFCSMRLLRCKEGYVFVPKPGRLFSKLSYFIQPPAIDPRVLVRGTALGLYEGCSGHPVIKGYLDKLLELTRAVEAKPARRFEWQMTLKPFICTVESMHDIYLTYGVGPEELKWLNVMYQRCQLGVQITEGVGLATWLYVCDKDTDASQVHLH